MNQQQLLILGLGNMLCGDDGVGVAAVETLRRNYRSPLGVEILDGGTLGLALLGWATSTERLLLVDAIEADLPAGSLVRLEGDAVAPAVRDRLSVHQIGVADLLDSMELIGRSPPVVSLIGLVPASVALMTGLTPAVLRGLPILMEAVVEEAASAGFPLIRRRDVAEPLPPRDDQIGQMDKLERVGRRAPYRQTLVSWERPSDRLAVEPAKRADGDAMAECRDHLHWAESSELR